MLRWSRTRVSTKLSKLMKSVQWLPHYSFLTNLQSVMKASRWSSGGTLTSFYLRDLCPQTACITQGRPCGGCWRDSDCHLIFLGYFLYLFAVSLVRPFGSPFPQKRGVSWGPPLGSKIFMCEPNRAMSFGSRTGRLPTLSVKFRSYPKCMIIHNYL